MEPARRAYADHNVLAIITGRRQSQGSDRATLQPIEIDSTGLVKVNPLCRWGFSEVKAYIDSFAVPYNELLDEGYKSVGDWHSTKVPVEGESERAGRWSGNEAKTECGLHKDYFKMFVLSYFRSTNFSLTFPAFLSQEKGFREEATRSRPRRCRQSARRRRCRRNLGRLQFVEHLKVVWIDSLLNRMETDSQYIVAG